jgi:hypothetical protein
MAYKTVKGYLIQHNLTTGASKLILHFTEGGSDSVESLAVAQAGFLIDLLRNEKPLNYETSSKTLSTTTMEPIGEGE